MGVRNFLERSVWAGSEDGLLMAPGANQPNLDNNGDGKPDDWRYESAATVSPEEWPDPYLWTRQEAFIRGQLDWVKATDLSSWGALYWLLQEEKEKAEALMDHADKLMKVSVVNQNGHPVTAFEYWDLPGSGEDPDMDDFGESIWLEGTAQMAYSYSLLSEEEKAAAFMAACEDPQVAYGFPGGEKGVPYAWPRNMIIDKGGPGDADDVEREDALSIASTTWTYIAKHKVGFLPICINQHPEADFEASPVSTIKPLQFEFTDKSYKATEWSWYFGDGTSSHEKDPVHIYENPGTYTVRLTVRNNCAEDSKEMVIDVFPFYYTLTPTFIFVWGDAFIVEEPVEPGDWIGVFAPGVITCNGCIGALEITETGQYGLVPVYGDDPTTGEKEGAVSGDTLSFKVWDKSEGELVNLYPKGPDDPIWEKDKEILNINLTTVSEQWIPLPAGWNLISFQVAKCFYEGDAPALSIIDSNKAEFEEKDNLLQWLRDDEYSPIRDEEDPNIAGDWQRIISFDENGAHLMDKDLPESINTLRYLSLGYGYWIKMNKPGFLILHGQLAATDTSLNLTEGWNLMGFISTNVCFARSPEVKDALCPYSSGTYQPDEGIRHCPADPLAETVFISISGKYRRIVSSDQCNGAMVYDTELPIPVNTLYYLGPKYGYWIKMLEDGELVFPDTSVCINTEPEISFTYVPPYGSSDNLEGVVRNIDYSEYKVAVYIKVDDVWWIKPYYASPLTSIKNDITWE